LTDAWLPHSRPRRHSHMATSHPYGIYVYNIYLVLQLPFKIFRRFIQQYTT